MTLNALNEILIKTSQNHFLVNDAFVGDVYEINAKENKFGLFAATPMTAIRNNGGYITYNYVLYYIDRLTKSENNMDLIQTDAVNMLKGLLNEIEEKYAVQVETDHIFTFFRHQFDDWCAGAYLEVDISVPDGDCGQLDFGVEYDLRSVTIRRNGIFKPLGFDGYSEVIVDIPFDDYAKKSELDEVDSRLIRLTNKVGEYPLPSNIALKTDIPSLRGYATEEWVEGKGYLTEHQDLSDYALKSDIPSLEGYVRKHSEYTGSKGLNYLDIVEAGEGLFPTLTMNTFNQTYPSKMELSTNGLKVWAYTQNGQQRGGSFVNNNSLEITFDNKSVIFDSTKINYKEGNENYKQIPFKDIALKSEIPSLTGYATEEWVEDKGYLTEHQSLADYALKSEIPSLTGYATEEWVENQSFVKSTDIPSPSDIATKDDIPSLEGYATEEWVQSQGYLTEHQSLEGYATEEWVEGKGYLTEHQSLEGYATETYVTTYLTENEYITKADIPSLTGYATEEWVQSQGYLTEHQSLADYALKSEIPSLTGYATEEWVEGKGYLTEHQDISGKFDKSSIWTGTEEQWNSLSDDVKASYTIALIR